MLRWWFYITLLAALAVANGHVLVEVEGGPEVEGRHLYVFVGGRWEPVHVAYQPEFIHTYIYATNETAVLPYYNLTRYVLIIPRGALVASQRASPPRGFEIWTLEVENGTRKVAIPLAVGPQPLRQDNETLTTWTTFSKQKIETRNKGRFVDKPKDRGRQGGENSGDVQPAGAVVSQGASTFAAGSLYFKPATVSGSFSTTFNVDSPTGYTTLCGYPQMHWVGYELWNMSLGVKVDGNLLYGTLVLELYRLDTCSKIEEVYLSLPSKGSYWTNIQFSKYSPLDPTLFNAPLGVRIRVSGYATTQTTISVMPVARYSKTVNSLAQIATSKAYTTNVGSFSVGLPAGATKSAILFGPYIAYDGGATPRPDVSFIGWIDVPAITVTLSVYFSYCPLLLFVEYYVNNVAYKVVGASPTTSTPIAGRCYYNVPAQTLNLRQREYIIGKAQSVGGGILVAVAFSTFGYGGSASVGSQQLKITYDRWIEPFHSQYYSLYGGVYSEWREVLTYNTIEFLAPINTSTTHIVTTVRARDSELAITLSVNFNNLCYATWTLSEPIGGYTLYYGNQAVEEPWWAELAKRVLDAIDWLLTIGGAIKNLPSISLDPLYNIFATTTGTVKIYTSGSTYYIKWEKGWLESGIKNVIIRLQRISTSNIPKYVEWSLYDIGIQLDLPWNCSTQLIRSESTIMYLPPSPGDPARSVAKIWTWRGQTRIGTGITEPG
ncbi:MAG: hypothetical protein QXI84_10150 [Thermofilaceae archaeon]